VVELRLRKEEILLILAVVLIVSGVVGLIMDKIGWDEFLVLVAVAVGLFGGRIYLRRRGKGRRRRGSTQAVNLPIRYPF